MGEGDGDGLGDGGDGVVDEPSLHTADSSPSEAKANLFWVITAALFDTPDTPVGVPVVGCVTLGLE